MFGPSAVSSVRIWAEAYRPQDKPYELFTASSSTKVHFRFNERIWEPSFQLSDCTIPSGTRWSTGRYEKLTRDPNDPKHYWARLEALEGVENGCGRITLNLVNVLDQNGNDGRDVRGNDISNTSRTYSSEGVFTVDTTRPKLERITLDKTRIKVGETARVQFFFSEKVTGASVKAAIDLSQAQAYGTLSDPYSTDGGDTWTAIFTPAANTETAEACKIGLNVSRVKDLLGNTGQAGAAVYSHSYSVDTRGPSLTADAITFSESILTRSKMNMTVTLRFSEPVKGLGLASLRESEGREIGERSTLSGPVASDPDANGYGTVWTVILTAPWNESTNNSENNKITVNLAGVTDRGGNQATGSVESSNTYAIDVKRPTAVITMSDTNPGIGEVATVTLRFSEKVTGLTLDDIAHDQRHSLVGPTLSDLLSSDGGQTWTFKLTPADLSHSRSQADPRSIFLRQGSVTDAAGNPGPKDDTYSPHYTADHSRPVLASSRIAYASAETDSTLDAGETATVTFVFSEAVTGFDSSCVMAHTNDAGSTAMIHPDAAGGTLSNPVSTDGGITWTATLTAPTASTTLTDVGLRVDMGRVTDASGNSGEGTAASDFRYTVNTTVSGTRPSATIALADSALTAGESTTVTIAFSERVNGFDATDVDLTEANGTLGPLTANADGRTWTATFTPTANVEDSSNTIRVNLTGVTDAAGNAATGSASSDNYTVDTRSADTTAPQLIGTGIDRPRASGNLLALNFSDQSNMVAALDRLPANGDFTVRVDGVANTVTNVRINEISRNMILTLSTPIAHGQRGVTVAYDDGTPADNQGIQDTAGNCLTSIPTTQVSNITLDATAPELITTGAKGPRVNASTVFLDFHDTSDLNQDDTARPNGSDFTVLVDGQAVTATATRYASGKTLALELNTSVQLGQTVSIAYQDSTPSDESAIRDMADNHLLSFPTTAVRTDIAAPVLITTDEAQRPRVSGDQLVLSFQDTSNLDATNKPAKEAFAVLVDGTAQVVHDVAVNAEAKTVTLTLATAVTQGQSVTVAYDDPTTNDDTHAIQDAAGNDATSFAATEVVNDTPAPADTTAPQLITSSDTTRPRVNGDQLVLSFDDSSDLDADADHKPDTRAFAVLVNGVANAVTNVTVDGHTKTVTLTLSTAVSHGQTVTVAYADPTTDDDANAIQDTAGNDATSFAATAVHNDTPAPADTTAPQLITSGDTTRPRVNGDQLVLSFGNTDNLDADPIYQPENEAFAVLVDGVENAVTNVTVDARAKTVTLTLTTAVSHGQSVTVAYADPTTDDDANAIQDAAGNDAANFAATEVVNDTPAPADTTPPQLITSGDTTRPRVNGDQLVLSFDDSSDVDADPDHKPANEAFAVLVDGAENAVTNVTVDGQTKTVTLTLSTALTHGQSVTVAYADPTTDDDANAIQDAAGNDATSFAATEVVNDTPAPADTTAPQLITSSDTTRPRVNGDQLVLSFDDSSDLDADADHKPDTRAFAVLVNGVANAVTNVTVDGHTKTVTLTLSTAVSHGQSVTVAYADPTTDDDSNAIQDAAGNDAAHFAATEVLNNTPAPADTTPPQLITTGTAGPRVLGSDLVLQFSDASNLDAAEAHK
ncbi:SwmB domain-containing protein, partial [Verminephrobacter aporrectodeae]|uniref:SwmB domain-containing protein n=2 Tax=Verminephrobacter aporrectodeae TaxID=1110389 RepID=UPI002243F6E8